MEMGSLLTIEFAKNGKPLGFAVAYDRLGRRIWTKHGRSKLLGYLLMQWEPDEPMICKHAIEQEGYWN